MKLLACSDIHNNVEAVRQLRAQERNAFDAILVAGDMGWETAADTLAILDTFGCPVYFVYGNWDHRLDYFSLDHDRRHQVHLNGFEQDGIYITGFSGCPAGWGQNPHAQALRQQVDEDFKPWLKRPGRLKADVTPNDTERYEQAKALAKQQALSVNRAALNALLSENPDRAKRTIVLTHERLFKLDALGSPLLHIHGHVHTYKHSLHKGSHILDVACLDPGSSPFKSAAPKTREMECGYFLITIDRNLAVTTQRKRLLPERQARHSNASNGIAAFS